MLVNKIIDEYDSKNTLYESFSTTLEALLRSLLVNSDIQIHSISSRVKQRNSLLGKINKVTSQYNSLGDITDICGLRIISLFENDVDKISNLVSKEFSVDDKNSIDKRAALDPDRFGYLSVHYVIELNASRLELSEYQLYSGLKAEIQIRSILQHAWAEIEHDIGYKSSIEVPKHIRRQFSRLAGLLELADQEFANIRDSLDSYQLQVERDIGKSPAKILLDTISLTDYIKNSKFIESLDAEIAKIMNFNITDYNAVSSGTFLSQLEFSNIVTVEELDSALIESKSLILEKCQRGTVDEETQNVNSGISIYYLAQILSAKDKNKKKVVNFLNKFNIGHKREDFANYLISLHRS
jgi:putative GTP pyrophosphokinase